MKKYANYPVPHLLGQVSYQGEKKLEPDGDTIHLRNPVLLQDGKAIPPENGQFQVWVTGHAKPRLLPLQGKPGAWHVPVRFEGTDAPEEHYRAKAFSLKVNGQVTKYPLDKSKPQGDRAQPLWSPATKYAVGTLEKTGWAIVMLDQEVVDKYNRALGYVYASTPTGLKRTFVSKELIRRGLSFPFVFASSGDMIPILLKAARAAFKARRGVWKNYQSAPLSYDESFPSPKHFTDEEPAAQQAAKLNYPVVFRRVVDAWQLQGVSLELALQKYSVKNYLTGQKLPGDQYDKIPIEALVWVP